MVLEAQAGFIISGSLNAESQALYSVAVTISDRTLGFDIWINITTECCVHFRRFQQISSCGDEKSCI